MGIWSLACLHHRLQLLTPAQKGKHGVTPPHSRASSMPIAPKTVTESTHGGFGTWQDLSWIITSSPLGWTFLLLPQRVCTRSPASDKQILKHRSKCRVLGENQGKQQTFSRHIIDTKMQFAKYYATTYHKTMQNDIKPPCVDVWYKLRLTHSPPRGRYTLRSQ